MRRRGLSVAGLGAAAEGRLFRRAFVATFAVATLFGLIQSANAHAFIYWADPIRGLIGRTSVTGAGTLDTNFITGANEPCGVTVDNQYIYWANTGSGTIGRAKLNGTDVNQSFITGGNSPCGPSTEPGVGQLYWANFGGNTIANAFSNGTNVNQNFINSSGANVPTGTATLADVVYWPSQFDATIYRATGEGFGVQPWAGPTYVSQPTGLIAVNSAGIYWVNTLRYPSATIGHVDLNGSNPTVALLGPPDTSQACGVAVDNSKLYWSTPGAIGRANLDGSSPNSIFINGAIGPCGLAVNADTALASASPASINFGNVLVGNSAGPQTVTLSNSSSTSVSLQPGTATITGTDAGQFSIGPTDTCSGQTIAPGASCTISVDFTPTSVGGKVATLSIPSNDPDAPTTVGLSGVGTDPNQTVTPTSIAFGSRLVNTQSPAQTVTLTNIGSAADNIDQAVLTGADAAQFGVVTDGCSNTNLPVGNSCQISVRFAPTATGPLVASLSIPSDAPNSPATVALSGTGTAPDESVLPGALQFGNQLVGTNSPTQSITVANTANASGPLVLGSASIAGAAASQFDKVSDNCSGQSLSPGDDCQIGVRFAPGSAGAAVASLQIPSNGGAAGVPLAGTGTSGPRPSSVFQLGTPRRLKNGTAILPVTVPGAGTLTLSGNRIKTQTLTVNGPGTVELTVQAKGKARKRVNGKGLPVIVQVVFTPSGGTAATHFATLKLRRGH